MSKAKSHELLERLFFTSKYSDLTISAGERQWKVHRAVVCLQSKFFAAACDGNFKESRSLEIHLKNEDPSCVQRMLLYLYTQRYNDICLNEAKIEFDKEDQSRESSLHYRRATAHFAICVLADKYEIVGLGAYAQKKFLDSFVKIADLDELGQVVQVVYTSAQSLNLELGSIIVSVCTDRISEIASDQKWLSLFEAHPQLSIDVIRELNRKSTEYTIRQSVARLRVAKLERCEHCGLQFNSTMLVRSAGISAHQKMILRCRRCGSSHDFWV